RCVEQNIAATVLALQPFTVQGGTPSGASDEEAACIAITRCPYQVTNTLETEHGIINIERNHRLVVGGITGCRSHPRCHRTELINALLQYLTFLVFAIVSDLVSVLRHVFLALARVNSNLAE